MLRDVDLIIRHVPRWTLNTAFDHWHVKLDANGRKLPLFLEKYASDCPDGKSVNIDIIWNPRTLRGHTYARAILIAIA